MHNLFEAMPYRRNSKGSPEGEAVVQDAKNKNNMFSAARRWLNSLVLLVAAFGLLWVPDARAGGSVTDCNEFALLTALQDGGLVTFDEDCTITLSGPIVITNDVTIDASGFEVVISGGSAVQLFQVQPGASLELIGLTLTEGHGTNGGAIFVDDTAQATITECVFIQNNAAGADGSDGVNGNPSSGTAGSGTKGGNGGGGWGGAIFNAGDLTVESTTFATNSATGGLGGNGGNGGNGGLQGGNGGNGGAGGIALGGAIYNAGTLSLKDCTFEQNQVTGGTGGTGGTAGSGSFSGLPGTGGAGAAGSGAGIYSVQDAAIVNCTFDSNTGSGGTSQNAGMATSGNGNNGARGGDSLGGGIFNSGANSAVTNCTFYGNKVTGGNGGNGGPGNFNAGNGGNGGNGSGGGYYNSGGSAVVNCTFSTCAAAGGTNGVAGTGSFPGSNGSPGRGRGGDMANGGGILSLYNTLLSTNSGGGNLTNISGTIEGANNISSDSSYHFSGISTNVAPKIGGLADNGGPTLTMALLANSPARDAGDDLAAPDFDQRDVVRPLGAHSDIGAYEFGFLISGRVTLGTNGLSGIKVTAGSQTTTTDITGDYELSALGPVVVTPSDANYNFSPASESLTVSGNITDVDFTATQKFSISGQVVGLSVPVSIAIGTNTITTDTNGNYSLSGLSGGSFTITPSAPGVNFSPASRTVILSSSTNGIDFFALFQISGRVLDGTNGLAGVTVLTGTNTASTDANGNYTFAELPAGDYFLSASRSGYSFNNPQEAVIGPSATNINFTVTGVTYTISGRITYGTNGLGGVIVTGGRTTDASGFYSIPLSPGPVTLTPTKKSYAFRPSSLMINLTNNMTNVDFIAGGLITSIVRSNNGSIQLVVSGPVGTTRIEASTNLIDWVSISTNTGSFGFTDLSATNYPQRFYRSSQP